MRHSEGRPRGSAWNDAQTARRSDVFRQPHDGRWIVRAGNGREQTFEANGEHLTTLTWNGVHISLGYKYDISLMMDDLLILLDAIQQNPSGQKVIHWVSSGFPFTWTARWNPESIQIDAQSRDETLAIELKGRESITTDRQGFLDSWKPILTIVYSRLRSAGYSATQLRNFRTLQNMTVGSDAEA